MSPWWLLSAPAAVALLAAVFALGYWRGSGAGYADGYDDGTGDLEEAMAEEDRTTDALCETLGCSRDELRSTFRAAFARLDRNAQSDALPDMRDARRREVN